jgi:hypothetical protein
MADALGSRWEPHRYQVLRRSLIETATGALMAIPPGFAEVGGSLLLMTREGVRVRIADGEIERLLEDGDLRKL